MSDTIIRVENLSKKYVLQHQQEGRQYKALRDVMVDGARSIGQRFSGKAALDNRSQEDFWALKDVNFEIKQGDRVGIIGRNGAGKSTLLKVLSRIVEPTSGRIGIKGRVASLLEVGTGFHPELTGRENIYLNGAILGMGRAEIARKFDEIVAFAEVEKFLDTPVKRYSSGMYVRLAFAVAAHLEPEVLIVDEVLAVGDAAFQEKCLGKMQDISANGGRTVIFVSHNIAAINKLCSDAIMLRNGSLIEHGNVNQVIQTYLDSGPRAQFEQSSHASKPTIVKAWVENPFFPRSEKLRLSLIINSPSQLKASIDLLLSTPLGIPVSFSSAGTLDYSKMVALEVGFNEITLLLDSSSLAIGQYLISLDITRPNVEYFDRCSNCLGFEIIKAGEGDRSLDQAWDYGCIELPLQCILKTRGNQSTLNHARNH
jgi:lipopolysaccharide transport system ATP-binding protein